MVDDIVKTRRMRDQLADKSAACTRAGSQTKEFDDLGLAWGQVIMAANAPMLPRASMVDGRLDVGILPTGQVVGVIDELPTVAALMQRIIGEAEETLSRLRVGDAA